jgi:hypothetical protein
MALGRSPCGNDQGCEHCGGNQIGRLTKDQNNGEIPHEKVIEPADERQYLHSLIRLGLDLK